MRLAPLLLVAALTAPAVGACATSESEASSDTRPATTTTVHDMGSMDGTDSLGASGSTPGLPKVECPQHMPADVLTAEEAHISFNDQAVCLAFVTVEAGTDVTWMNTDTRDHQITLTDESGTTLDTLDVAAGSVVVRTMSKKGLFFYKLTAIETFTGTIDVK